MNDLLAGVRVLDMTRNVGGPYSTMILAELGADVVKVEAPGRGDDTRGWGPPFWNRESPTFLAVNRNKRSITLDLKHPDARAVMERLVDRADALVESFRPGSLDELGFGHDWALARNPRLVYGSVSAFGETGPLASSPGYDPQMQALTGIMSLTGERDGPPMKVGVALVDQGAGLWTALGVVAALLGRERSGRVARVGTSLYETSIGFLARDMASYWASGKPVRRSGSGAANAAPSEAFATADGDVIITCASDQLFVRLAETLGHPEWTADPRFRRAPDRVGNRAALHEVVEACTRTFTSASLLETFTAAGVPCSPIRDMTGTLEDAQAAALGIFQSAEHPAIPGFRSVGIPLRVDGERPPLRTPPPALGADTAAVLAEIGFGRDEVERLLRSPATTG